MTEGMKEWVVEEKTSSLEYCTDASVTLKELRIQTNLMITQSFLKFKNTPIVVKCSLGCLSELLNNYYPDNPSYSQNIILLLCQLDSSVCLLLLFAKTYALPILCAT